MGSDKAWLRDVTVCGVHGDTAWYVCYETKTHRLRLTHRGTWSMDDMDIYYQTKGSAYAALHVAPCPMEDPYSRITELESTITHLREVAAEQHAWEEMAERCGLPPKPDAAEKCIVELREAVRVLAAELARVPELVTDAVLSNPIAAAAVRGAEG